jgi:DNA-binding protein
LLLDTEKELRNHFLKHLEVSNEEIDSGELGNEEISSEELSVGEIVFFHVRHRNRFCAIRPHPEKTRF